jgi:hypothetical protein
LSGARVSDEYAAWFHQMRNLADGLPLALNARTGARVTALWAHVMASAFVVGDGQIAVVTRPQVLDLYGLPGS